MFLCGVLTVVFGVCVIFLLALVYRNIRRLNRELADMKGRPSEKIVTSNQDLPVAERTIHDLNNLIGTISGFAGAAVEELPKSSAVRSDLVEILEASERAAKLVSKLRQPSDKAESDTPTPAEANAERLQTGPIPSPHPQKIMRISSYPPVAKPVPPYEKQTGEFIRSAALPKSDSKPPGPNYPEVTKKTMSSYPPPPKSAEVKRQDRREHLLIVDDELQLLTMFRRIFEPQGYQVTTFSNGLIAWEEFQRNKDNYDLAILDQRMPDMSGTSLAIEMLNYRPDFPIILLSGYSDTISPEDATRIGIRRFLCKPIPQAELSATIRKTLDETNRLST